ncbi:Squamosa promoter-binding-like protein 16 [Rhynchospora pubera]|uniref:Squamosa promoter-binding-like protein 16 n=1 Tax=Rhynchospora pubera TaxID=906938 RepID=A0AAV8EL27_9POAL|nr:Squamosa promoter-binding-like protein 16 [Rhynchospora pubera]KAJ4785800.1 Squamosa promoter-binding-like protein 16 [Rhynchospora pubera]
MDWDLKMPPPPWDIVSDLDLTTPSGPGPCAPVNDTPPSPNPLDLKLNTGISMTPGPMKRPRPGPMAGAHVSARCLVEGCKADLSKCREYHRRHKVCEVHSKTPVVIVSGREQRFCQQCSRFHMLGEFDDAKRSCRKRLEGHNRRRRKPQSNSLSTRGLLANHQGSRFGSYPPIFPSIRTESNNWAIKSEPISFPSSLYPPLHSYPKPKRQFPFLNETTSDITFTSSFTSLPGDPTSDCALSLLSSPVLSSPVQSSSSIVTTGTATNRISITQPLVSGFQFGASSGITGANGFSERRVGTFAVSGLGGAGEIHSFQGSFQLGAGEGSSQPLPFSWQ